MATPPDAALEVDGAGGAPVGTDAAHASETDDTDARGGFRVALADFDGPFDLLLSLITKRELDITEVSLSAVTDEFIAYLRALEGAERLDEASEFLVVAATLLDMKIASLLPQGELVDAVAQVARDTVGEVLGALGQSADAATIEATVAARLKSQEAA